MWLKYSDAPITKDGLTDREQQGPLSAHSKPNGFWITDDSEDCWRSWCLGKRWGLKGLTHKHAVDLDESGVLILRSTYEIDQFTAAFAVEKWWGPEGDPRKWRDLCIDWAAVAKKHAGLIITPYQWSRRLDDNYTWYYGWDCASGCIWKADAILDVRLIEIDHEIAKAREEEAA